MRRPVTDAYELRPLGSAATRPDEGPPAPGTVATSVGWQNQELSSTDSLQVNVGVATGRWRLFKADAYVGYLWQNTRYDTLLGVSRSDVQSGSPSFGLSLTWDPLRYLVVSGTASNVPNATGAVLGGIVGAAAGHEISAHTGGSKGNQNIATAAGAVAGAVNYELIQ
jgi:hypothetical protein